ncbi:MAG: transcriptional regulator [Candidatus Woesearchaeota archaeon]
MQKRTPYELRKEILMCLKEKEMTFTELQTKLSTNYDSIKKNCFELQEYEQVEIKKEKKHKKNGKPYYLVKLTEKGYKTVDTNKHIKN